MEMAVVRKRISPESLAEHYFMKAKNQYPSPSWPVDAPPNPT